MNVVQRWTGQDARTLREAMRMTVRDFAAHLGVSDRTVSKWESGGASLTPGPASQETLDAALKMANGDTRERFTASARRYSGDRERPAPPPAPPASAVAEMAPGSNSSARSASIVAAVRGEHDEAHYRPPVTAIEDVRHFIDAPSRVFVLTGAAGSGKTQLTYHLATGLGDLADIQLHAVSSWEAATVDLAEQILRYGSIPSRTDPMITMEQVGESLTRPLLVVIDGINGQAQFDNVAREVDTVLRHVDARKLKFLLAVRTPPEIRTAAFPVLSASTYHGRPLSHELQPWDLATTRQMWDDARPETCPSFDAIPAAVQQLMRVPMYLHLVRTGGGEISSQTNAYQLVEQCVRSLTGTSAPDQQRTAAQLRQLARHRLRALIPARLNEPSPDHPTAIATDTALVRTSDDGWAEFSHDVFAEYFLATHLADRITQQGRSAATVEIFNDLAEKSAQSASAREVFQFVVHALDRSSPTTLASIAQSPMANRATTLPLLMQQAGFRPRFHTPDVLRTCAQRCTGTQSLELAKSMLAIDGLPKTLGSDWRPWFTGLLRTYGVAIWQAAATCAETMLDAVNAHTALATADLDQLPEATFFARFYFLFTGDDASKTLITLANHVDWRVRAALGQALHDRRCRDDSNAQALLESLVVDSDYKVRAVAAAGICRVSPQHAEDRLRRLLLDENWHVRGKALEAVLCETSPSQRQALAHAAIATIDGDPAWQHCPSDTSKRMQRLLLLHGNNTNAPEPGDPSDALFILLRELRTGRTSVPESKTNALAQTGRASRDWRITREAASHTTMPTGTAALIQAPSTAETFRKIRGQRRIQVALDLHDLDYATQIAKAAVEAGADLIEVGDPLIKSAGLAAVSHIKQQLPQATIIAEMMSADWGREQVELAATAGADAVLLIGPATVASVTHAVDTGRRLGVPVVLDIPNGTPAPEWIRDMESAGVDGFTVTTNIDLGIGGHQPLHNASTTRGLTRLPVAVSGGFSPTDRDIITAAEWDILIVGRSITESTTPTHIAQQFTDIARTAAGRATHDHHTAVHGPDIPSPRPHGNR